jgi:hypothetical protein
VPCGAASQRVAADGRIHFTPGSPEIIGFDGEYVEMGGGDGMVSRRG